MKRRPTNRKVEIIETASALFNERGYNNITMRILAAEMGIKAASLYNHISSKQEILATTILGLAKKFVSGIEEIAHRDIDPIEKIKNIVLVHIEFTLEDPNGMASLQTNWMYLEGDNLLNFKQMRSDYEQSFRDIIKDGISQGVVKAYSPEIILFSILTTLRSLYMWYPKQKNIDKNVLKEEMISVTLKGFVNT